MSQITLPSDMTLDEYLTLYLMQFGAAQMHVPGLAPGEAFFLDMGVEHFGYNDRATVIDRLCDIWRSRVQSNPADNGKGTKAEGL